MCSDGEREDVMKEGMQEGCCDQNGLMDRVRQRQKILCANPKDSSLKEEEENYTEICHFSYFYNQSVKHH